MKLQSIIGLLILVLLAWLFSENRRRLNLKAIAVGLGLQIALALILLKMPGSQSLFMILNELVQALERATMAGTGFVFG